jgi:hypothetical protein
VLRVDRRQDGAPARPGVRDSVIILKALELDRSAIILALRRFI